MISFDYNSSNGPIFAQNEPRRGNIIPENIHPSKALDLKNISLSEMLPTLYCSRIISRK